ncbi:hypothetical protein WI90_26470 [Burkholderia ubonensis]|uniref:hypothetical protein n=1 Tax=Burkholderia ubonensis TaxID=101571 RepID=UPI00075459A8|nr:hypothetical protein [Burkholderia ubonensis]KVD85523.1 hypothetical protein WI90_26470 [Burkholderia ubonensis]
MTHNDDQDAAFGAEMDATVANLVDELRMLPYEQLLRHAALTTLAAREYSALLEQKGALLRSAIEDAADSGERLAGC